MENMLVVGIDVGGTKIKFGLIEDGKIIRSMELGTNAFDIIRQLCNGAREIVQSSDRSWDEVDGIGIGFPGMVVNSVVLDSPNISLQNCNLKEILETELGKFVVVKNDAEMATLAEHKIGAGAGCNNMVLITLGTGVGGGIIINKKLYVGAGGAGELGHIMFEKNGRACSCGRKGCAEQYVSMKALDSLSKDIMVGYPNTCVDFNGDGLIYASELAKAYKRNDACAIEIVDKFVDDLTQYLLDLCNLFRPNRIIIGGGVTHAPEIIDMVARNCRRLEYGYRNSPKVDIMAAQLGNQAGVLGGFVCVEEELNPKDMDDTYEDDSFANEYVSNIDNMSLLDSITRSMDMDNSYNYDLDSVVGVDNNSFLEESNGQYVNKVLEDISSEINTIKNEELLGDEEPEDTEIDHSYEGFVNIYQEGDEIEGDPNSADNTAFMSAVTTINDIADDEPLEVEPVEDNVEEYVEDLPMEESATVEHTEEPEIDENADKAEITEEDDYDSEEGLSLGLNDIFFGTADEHADKLDKIDLSSVSIVDNNIVETAPVEVVENNNINGNVVEENTFNVEVSPTMPVTTEPVAQNNSVVYDVTMVEEMVEKPKQPIDNSIFVPPVQPVIQEPVPQSEPVAPVEQPVTEQSVVDNAPTPEMQAEAAAIIDNISKNVISDYNRLLDAMGKIDVANTQQNSAPNLSSRVSSMLDNQDQQ